MNNFILKTLFADLVTRSFELTTPTILDPTNGNPLVMGEWLEFDSSVYKLKRGTGDAAGPSFPFYQGQGAYDIQVIGKAPVLMLNPFEADTLVFDAAGLTQGCALMVADVTFGGLTRRGLKLAAGTAYVVGYVTRLPAVNNNYLRFIRVK